MVQVVTVRTSLSALLRDADALAKVRTHTFHGFSAHEGSSIASEFTEQPSLASDDNGRGGCFLAVRSFIPAVRQQD